MGLLNNLVNIASAEVGYHEGYNNDNKYGAEYGFNNVAWCCIFAWWICNKAGVEFPKAAHCNQVEAYAREHGQWVTTNYKAGDFVIWDYDGNGERDHIGLVIDSSTTSITTIEGNSGDAVRKATKSYANIIGAYRPNYGTVSEVEIAEDVTDINVGDKTSPTGDELSQVEEPAIVLTLPNDGAELASLQYALHAHGYTPANSRKKNGDFDGEIGAGTIEAATACAMDNGFDSYAELWQWLGGVGLG